MIDTARRAYASIVYSVPGFARAPGERLDRAVIALTRCDCGATSWRDSVQWTIRAISRPQVCLVLIDTARRAYASIVFSIPGFARTPGERLDRVVIALTCCDCGAASCRNGVEWTIRAASRPQMCFVFVDTARRACAMIVCSVPSFAEALSL